MINPTKLRRGRTVPKAVSYDWQPVQNGSQRKATKSESKCHLVNQVIGIELQIDPYSVPQQQIEEDQQRYRCVPT